MAIISASPAKAGRALKAKKRPALSKSFVSWGPPPVDGNLFFSKKTNGF
jgi:hypothetical protein